MASEQNNKYNRLFSFVLTFAAVQSVSTYNTSITTTRSTNATSSFTYSFSSPPPEQKVYRKCTYKHLENCHPYIRNVLALYTRSGGWVLLGIVLVGCTMQIYLMTQRKYKMYHPVKRRDLEYKRRTSLKWV